MSLRRFPIGLMFLALAAAAQPAAAAAPPVEVHGHRGARALAPENTLAGFAHALSIGVDALELDLAVTADDVVVVSHDPILQGDIVRGPTGTWLDGEKVVIRDLTYDELLKYDVGRIRPASKTWSKFPAQTARDGERIPTLAQVFKLADSVGNRDVRFNIEIKTSPFYPHESAPPELFAKLVVDQIRAAGVAGRTIVQGFDWRPLQTVRELAPEVKIAYLTAERSWLDTIERGRPGASPWTGTYDVDHHDSVPHMVKAAGGSIWSPYYPGLTVTELRTAHELGLKVVVWTVNEPIDMERMIVMGVDGIITDRPDLLRQELRRYKRPLPKPTPLPQ